MLVRFGSQSDSCGPFCSMPFGDLRAYRRGPCSCLKHSWFFGFTYMQVRQRRKVQAGHSSYFVRKAQTQFEMGDSNRVWADTIDEASVVGCALIIASCV